LWVSADGLLKFTRLPPIYLEIETDDSANICLRAMAAMAHTLLGLYVDEWRLCGGSAPIAPLYCCKVDGWDPKPIDGPSPAAE